MEYINTNANILWGKNELTKEYLIGVKQRGDMLIDIENKTYFDTENNKWKPIPSDDNPNPTKD